MTPLDLADALRRVPPSDVRQPSAAERVASALRQQIVDGVLGAGTRLTEETISAGLGVSRNTVREAFTLLIAERIALREPNRGVFVAAPTVADVRDLYATRLAIEPAAVEHGRAWSDAAVSELRAIVGQASAALGSGDKGGVAQANQRFHRALVGLAGSRRLDDLMQGVLAEMRLVFHPLGETSFHDPYVSRNAGIVELLERGDRAGAAAALRVYLSDAEAELVAAMEGAG